MKIEVTKDWCIRMARLEVETGADMEIGGASAVASPDAVMLDPSSDLMPETSGRESCQRIHCERIGSRA
jgi:hypothetical protein